MVVLLMNLPFLESCFISLRPEMKGSTPLLVINVILANLTRFTLVVFAFLLSAVDEVTRVDICHGIAFPSDSWDFNRLKINKITCLMCHWAQLRECESTWASGRDTSMMRGWP